MTKPEKQFPPYNGPFMEVLSRSENGIAPKPLSLNLLDAQLALPREVLCGGGYVLKCTSCKEQVRLDEKVFTLAKARLAESFGLTHIACPSCACYQFEMAGTFMR